MIRPALILGAVAAALAAGWWIYAREQKIASQDARIESLTQTVENYQEAARITNDYIRSERRIREELEATIEELSTLEGADDPLSDYGRAVLDRVR